MSNSDVISAPTNVQLRRVSPTALEVTWDPPSYHIIITNYRVYYNTMAVPDMSRWRSIEVGPYTRADITGLEPHTVYAVRVQAKVNDGRYGNYSEIASSNVLEHG